MRYAVSCSPNADSTSHYKAIAMVVEYDTPATKGRASPCYPLSVGVIMINEDSIARRYCVSIGKNKIWYYRTLRTAMTDNNIAYIKDTK